MQRIAPRTWTTTIVGERYLLIKTKGQPLWEARNSLGKVTARGNSRLDARSRAVLIQHRMPGTD